MNACQLPKPHLQQVRFLPVFSKCPAYPMKADSISSVVWTTDDLSTTPEEYKEGELVDVGKSLSLTCPPGMALPKAKFGPI